MALGIFILLISFWSVGQWTLVRYMTMSQVLALLAMAGNLVPYAWSGSRLGMERLEWFLFNVLAVGPILFSALLWSNFLITGPSRSYIVDLSPRYDVHRYWIEHGSLPAHLEVTLSSIDTTTARLLEEWKGRASALDLARGWLGYDVILHWGPGSLERSTGPH
jgi:hypothetical protein